LVRDFGVRIKDVDGYDEVPERPYAMVFIDNAPAERRQVDLNRFINSWLVIVHDSEYYDLDFSAWPHRFDYTVTKPNTTVVSYDFQAIERIRSVFK
jgi:hypothetical protein